MSKVYAFDVDHTLEVSGGPIKVIDLLNLRREQHILGLCGNWARAVNTIIKWDLLFSFLGPMDNTKEYFLRSLSSFIPAEEFIMVGNDHRDKKWTEAVSTDAEAAELAGWRFLSEQEFADGKR